MIKLLAYSADIQSKQISFSCNDGRTLDTDRWEDVAGFLLQPCEFAVVYHIDEFFNSISELLPNSAIKELNAGGRVITSDNRKLYYQVGRMLGINHINIYGLSRYSNKVITDTQELAKLAQDVIGVFENVFGITPTGLSSPVSAYETVLNKVSFPRACDLPDSALGMISKCDERKWVEWRAVYKLGHWQANEVMDCDIIYSYPSLIAKLPDIRGAKFFESDEMPDEEDYSWGEMEGVLTITSDVTPFLHIGSWEDSITTEYKWLIDKYELGEFKFKHGWFFKLPQSYKLPFKETMEELYKARQNANLLVKTIAKAISVGIGGKFAQRYDDGKLGLDYQPIYSRLITSRCAIKVADMIWRNGLQSSIISVLVDGFLAENNGVNINIGNSGMGSWRVNPPSPFLVTSLLYQWGAEKHPNKLYYDDMMAQIKANPNNSVYGDIDLNLLSHDRYFPELPKTGKELLDKHYISIPVEIDVNKL